LLLIRKTGLIRYVISYRYFNGDTPSGDLPGDLQPILEPLEGLMVDGNLRPDELQSHILIELPIIDAMDGGHAAFAQLCDELVPLGKGGSPD
jgi:hypothetical protein